MTQDIEAYEKLRQRTLGPLKNKDRGCWVLWKNKATMLSPMKNKGEDVESYKSIKPEDVESYLNIKTKDVESYEK